MIAGRMAKAIAEMVHYDEYDYVIINEDFEQALFQLRSIIECQRLEMRHQQQAQKTCCNSYWQSKPKTSKLLRHF